MIRDFNINFSDVEISNIYKRIKDYPWQSMPDIDNWRYGTNFSYIKKLCDYWVKEFKWRNFEKKINSFSNYGYNVYSQLMIIIYFPNYNYCFML